MSFSVLLSSIGLVILGLLVILIRKVARIDREVWNLRGKLDDAGVSVFKQIEALGNVNAMLKLPVPLPATGGWAAAADFLLVIARHASTFRPAVIVECSCGVSTIALARCVQLSGTGHVFSLEHNPEFAQLTRDNLASQGLSEYATVMDAPLASKSHDGRSYDWYTVPEKLPKQIDLLIIDGPPASVHSMARFPAGPELFPRIRHGGAVFLDDASREGERACVAEWRTAFPEVTVEYLELQKGCICLRF